MITELTTFRYVFMSVTIALVITVAFVLIYAITLSILKKIIK